MATRYIIQLIGVFLFQFLFSEVLTINTVRPDFPIIYIMYLSMNKGRFQGVIIGFFLGLLIDLAGTSSYFGLTPLTYSTTAYISGFLATKSENINAFYFSLSWIGILVFHFFIFALVRYQTIVIEDTFLFLIKWFSTTFYTLGFMFILQFIYDINPNRD